MEVSGFRQQSDMSAAFQSYSTQRALTGIGVGLIGVGAVAVGILMAAKPDLFRMNPLAGRIVGSLVGATGAVVVVIGGIRATTAMIAKKKLEATERQELALKQYVSRERAALAESENSQRLERAQRIHDELVSYHASLTNSLGNYLSLKLKHTSEIAKSHIHAAASALVRVVKESDTQPIERRLIVHFNPDIEISVVHSPYRGTLQVYCKPEAFAQASSDNPEHRLTSNDIKHILAGALISNSAVKGIFLNKEGLMLFNVLPECQDTYGGPSDNIDEWVVCTPDGIKYLTKSALQSIADLML
jgi:hypothetical protein